MTTSREVPLNFIGNPVMNCISFDVSSSMVFFCH